MRKIIYVAVILILAVALVWFFYPKEVPPEQGGEFNPDYMQGNEDEPLDPELENYMNVTTDELVKSTKYTSTLSAETISQFTAPVLDDNACRSYADFSGTINQVVCDLYFSNDSNNDMSFVVTMMVKDPSTNCTLQCEEHDFDPVTFEPLPGYYADYKYVRLAPAERFLYSLYCTPVKQIPVSVEVITSPQKINVLNKCS